MENKTYTIIIYGCQMNKSDAERIKTALNSLGLTFVDDEMKADFVFFAACSVRQNAVNSIYTKVKNLQKKRAIKPITFLTGCVLDHDKRNFQNKFNEIFNIKDLNNLKNIISKYAETPFENKMPDDYLKIKPFYKDKYSVFVPIMTGCNNFCSYCVVPYVRGRERSRDAKDVLSEIKEAVRNGAKEIILLGQNVNSYNPADAYNFSKDNIYKKNNFAKLLWEINNINGINRINFTSSHPKDIDDEIIDALKMDKMANYIHLALQSGDDNVLARMKRIYTVKDFKKIINKIRKIKPEIAVGTDLIIGFCGETDEEFENTINFYKKIKFDISYNSKYHDRKGTFANKNLKDSVPIEIKKKRWRMIQEVMEDIAFENNQRYKNKTIEVLVNDYNKEKKLCSGWSREYKYVQFASEIDMAGQVIKILVKEAGTWVLRGDIK